MGLGLAKPMAVPEATAEGGSQGAEQDEERMKTDPIGTGGVEHGSRKAEAKVCEAPP